MTHITSEGKFDENTYLIDAGVAMETAPFKAIYVPHKGDVVSGVFSIFLIENNGMRMLVDAGTPDAPEILVKRLKKWGVHPIHKIFLTHSHWDHMMGVQQWKDQNEGTEIEVYVSANRPEYYNDPGIINNIFDQNVAPIPNFTTVKDGDIIDLNGLELEVIDLFGHTMDSIGLIDKKNKIIHTGDAIIDRFDNNTVMPTFQPPDFHEPELLETFKKLRDRKSEINSIGLAHYGIWKGDGFDRIVNEMEEVHIKTRDSIIRWYGEDPSTKHIAEKYTESICTGTTKVSTGWKKKLMELEMDCLVAGLKSGGLI